MINVYKYNTQILENLTLNEFSHIAEDLTLDNPDYYKAKKFSKYNRIALPKHIFYYKRLPNNSLEVPSGYNIPFEHKILDDKRLEVTVSYPKISIELRKAQEKARKSYLDNPENGLIVMPTGMGKSILGIYLAYTLRQKCLVIVHKNDLVDGWKKDIEMCFEGKVKSGLIKAKSRKIGRQITIATIQTLNRLSNRELSNLVKEFGMVIIDECLVGDTMIAKKDGGFVFIKDIKNQDKIIGGKVSNKFNRVSQIWRLESKHSIIEGSPTHPTFVLPQEKIDRKGKNIFYKKDLEVRSLKDIREGDYVPILKSVPHVEKYKWTPEQLAFVALIQADGHLDRVGNRVKVNISPKDEEYIREVFIKGVKSFNSAIEIKERRDCRGNLTLWTLDKELKDILEFVFEIPRGKKSNKITINKQIQYSPKISIKSYIETLFNCEGDLSAKKDNTCRVNFNTASKYFALGLSHMLKKFSIISNYQEIKPKKKNHSTNYRLIIGGNDFNTFFKEFSLIERKTPKFKNKNILYKGYNLEDYTLVRVKRVYKTDRVEKVYDFTTTNHTFIANGLLTHNCHHCPASSYDMINNFQAYYKIGLTATPERNDGLDKAMNFYLGDIAYKHKSKDDINEDILPVKVKVRNCNTYYRPKLVLDKGKFRFKTKDDKNLEEFYIDQVRYEDRPRINFHKIENTAIINLETIKQVCNDIALEYNLRRNLIVFFNQKDHCEIYYDTLIEDYKIPENKVQLYYGDSTESVEVMKEKAEKGEVKITLATYSIATEGTNVKSWEIAFLVGSINNGKNVEQAVGRIRRTKKGKISPVLVYDYRFPNVYILKNHGRTRDLRYEKLKFEFEGKKKQRKLNIGYQ